MIEKDHSSVGTSISSAFSALYIPIGCMMGLIAGLFWLVLIGLAIFCVWIWSLPSPK